jgi:hypothetical protein
VVCVSVEGPPRELVPAGTVLELSASQWKYGDGPLTLRVQRERADLSIYYDDQIWVQGWRLDAAGAPIEWLQALVPVDVILSLMTLRSAGSR